MAFVALEPLPERKVPRGRPKIPYSIDIVEEIADIVGEGKFKLGDVCASDDRYPSTRLFYMWLDEYPEAARVWTAALMARNNLRNEECIEIADDAVSDFVAETDPETQVTTLKPRAGLISRVEMQLKERHRIVAVELPHKYGAREALPAAAAPLAIAPPVTQAAEGVVSLQEFKDGKGDPYWAAARSYQREEEKAR